MKSNLSQTQRYPLNPAANRRLNMPPLPLTMTWLIAAALFLLPTFGNSLVAFAKSETPEIKVLRTVCDAPEISAPGGLYACNGNSATLTANASGAISYIWSNGQSTASISVNTSGTYSVRAIYSGCTSAAASVDFTQAPGPWTGTPITSFGMTLYLPFENSIQNKSSSTGTVTSVGAPVFTTDRMGRPNSAISLDGVDDYLDLPLATYVPNASFTFTAWIKPRTLTAWARILALSNGAGTSALDFASATGTNGNAAIGIWKNGTGYPGAAATSPLPLNTWSHVAILSNGSSTSIYVNGQLAGTASINGANIPTGTFSINQIGRSPWNEPLLNADLDEIRIYAYALQDSEILQMSKIGQQVSITASATTACASSPMTLTGPDNVGTYSWSDGTSIVGTSQTYMPSVSGTYTLSVTNPGNACVATLSQTVTLYPAVPVPAVSVTAGSLCDGTATLTASSAGATNFLWSNGATTASITPGPGTYSVKAWSGSAACSVSSTSFVIANTDYSGSNISAGMRFYFPFENSSNDMSGNGINPSAGSVSYTADRFGRANGAALFNGTSNYLALPTATYVNGDFSTSAWVKLTGIATWTRLLVFSNGGGNSATIMLMDNPSRNAVFDLWDVGYSVNSATHSNVASDNVWYQVVYRMKSDTAQIFINGIGGPRVFVGGAAAYRNNISTATNYIGRSEYVDAYAKMALDELRFYNRALSNAEITQLQTYSGNLQITQSTSSPACGSITLSGPPNLQSYSWSNSTNTLLGTGRTYTATTSDTYTLTGISSGASSCSATASVSPIITPQPDAPAVSSSAGNVICNNEPLTLTATLAGAASYIWSTGETSQAITVSNTGTYTVTATVNGCTSAQASITVSRDQGPWSGGALSNNMSFYLPLDNNVLDASGNNIGNVSVFGNPEFTTDRHGRANGALSFDGTNDYLELPMRSYVSSSAFTFSAWIKPRALGGWARMLALSDGPSARALDFAVAQVTNGQPTLNIWAGSTVSGGKSGTRLELNTWQHVVMQANNGVLQVWVNGESTGTLTLNPTTTPSGAFTYNFIGKSPWNGEPYLNADMDEIRLYTRALSGAEVSKLYRSGQQVSIGITGNETACSDAAMTLNGPINMGAYRWSLNGSTLGASADYIPSQSGTYVLEVTNPIGGCTATLSKAVTVNQTPATPAITPSGPLSFCTGGSVTLSSSSASGNIWSNGATTSAVTINASASITLRTTALGCTSQPSAATVVTLNQAPGKPSVSNGSSLNLCNGGSVTLTSSALTGNIWSTGETNRSITASVAGSYTVYTVSNGCTSEVSEPAVVTVSAAASPMVSVSSGSLCAGDATLTASGGSNYLWSNGATTASISPGAGTYTVAAIAGSCTSASSAPVTIASPDYAGSNISGGMRFYFPFENSSNDMSGNGINPTAGAVTYTTDRFGRANGAAQFNGVSNYLKLPAANYVNGDFTVTAWVKPTAVSLYKRLLVFSNGTGNNPIIMCFDHTNRHPDFEVWNTGYSTSTASHSNVAQNNVWYHVVYRMKSDTMQIFVNGVGGTRIYAGAEPSIGGTPGYRTNLVTSIKYIGRSEYVNQYASMALDELRMYNRALSNSEVAQLQAFSGNLQIAQSQGPACGAAATLSGPPDLQSYSWTNAANNLLATSRTYIASESGTYKLTGVSAGSTACTATASATVTISAPPAGPGISSSSNAVCPGNTAMLSAPASNGYIWSNGSTSQSILVSYADLAAPQTFTVQVISGSCTSLASAGYTLSRAVLPASAGPVSGNAEPAEASAETYTVPAVSGAASYAWTYTGTGAVFSASTTVPSVTISYGAGATSGVLSVQGVNNCGSGSTSQAFTVTISAPQDLVISNNMSLSGSYRNISFSGGHIAQLSGNLAVSGNITVPDGAELETKCFIITGAGSFTLQGGGKLVICNSDGIAQSGNTGAIRTTGGRLFSNDAIYEYNGVSAQLTGQGLPARVRSLTANNAQGLSLSSALSVSNTLTAGAGTLNLNGLALTLLSSKTGTARLAEVPQGATLSNADAFTVRRWLDTAAVRNEQQGFGAYYWLGASVTGKTVDAWNTSANVYVPWTYDGQNNHGSVWLFDNGNNAYPANGGWFKPASPSTGVNPGRGVRVWFNNVFFATGATTSLSGIPVTGDFSMPVSYCTGSCAGNSAVNGWNLAANPYPSTIDWNSGNWIKTNIADAIYVWRHKQNAYSSYVNGVGTMGGSNLIASGQGFMVRAIAAGPILKATEGIKTASAASAMRAGALSLLRLKVSTADLYDEAVIVDRPGSERAYEAHNDAAKYLNPGLSIWSEPVPGSRQAIASMMPQAGDTVSIRLKSSSMQTVFLSAVDFSDWTERFSLYILDNESGSMQPLEPGSNLAFALRADQVYKLSLVLQPAGATHTSLKNAISLSVQPNPSKGTFTLTGNANMNEIHIFDNLGRSVHEQMLNGNVNTISVNLHCGIYTVRVYMSNGTKVSRLVIE
ncbi:MAG: LamG-like jellyroll fold domain-containing protein [Bacteroidota bacterium]